MNELDDDQLLALANQALNTLTTAAANHNMNDAVAQERARLAEIWSKRPDLNPVYIGDKILYEPVMMLVSLQYEDDGVTPLFVIGPVNNGLAYTSIETLSKMRADYLLSFRLHIGNIEKYNAAIDILTGELKEGPDQIYADIPEFTVYRKMGQAGYSWSNEMQLWYK
jgi:hypothetical protein